ncbi:hypothetical protein RhiirA5_505883 [Rhizophagus irregularis]|uniref:Crinkler effector protein N-terminal domain-containing protein n=1 Tax=Rhizophagus irregularis TaxID=588596 RepID=A0A2N0NX03_9GLOM|nr:hypothetical protein RhiirA5_505883 [Rhizophagus irregularis]
MVFSLNCIILGDTITFSITLGKIVILDDIQYDISEFRISNLKRYIFSKKKKSKLSGISDSDDLNLWQVNVSKDKLEGIYTTEHITNELNGKKMDEVDFITNYFDVDHRLDKNIHIIIVPFTSTDDGMKKDSLFYSLMTEISLLVINKQSPLIIACCTATLARPFHEIVQVSHQKRVFLQIRSLDSPKKKNEPVFKNTPLLNMLVSDMGGNGRALEALQSAIKGVDFENSSFLSIAEQVYYKLKDHYSEWINYTRYLTPVLRAIMTHTKLVLSAPIPGTDILPEELSKLGLVKLEKQDDLSDKGTLTCPYIWLWLMANASDDSILRNWNFKYYSEIQNKEDPTIPPGCQFWQHFKHFIASFRVLKSNVFEINQEIELQDIHAGARHNFGSATIRNVPLSLKRAIRRESTKSSAYSTNKTVTCKEGDDQIDIDLTDASVCIISAPAGDSFCPIYLAGSTQQSHTVFHTECHQYKCYESTIVNQTTFNEKYKKASDKGDVFLFYTCGPSNVPNLPLLSAIVDRNNWKLYFGPFVGRAFLLARSDKFNINNCSKSEMTSIYGIGSKRADLLMSNRPYRDLEDCIARTNIPRNFLINFQFGATPSSTSPN